MIHQPSCCGDFRATCMRCGTADVTRTRLLLLQVCSPTALRCMLLDAVGQQVCSPTASRSMHVSVQDLRWPYLWPVSLPKEPMVRAAIDGFTQVGSGGVFCTSVLTSGSISEGDGVSLAPAMPASPSSLPPQISIQDNQATRPVCSSVCHEGLRNQRSASSSLFARSKVKQKKQRKRMMKRRKSLSVSAGCVRDAEGGRLSLSRQQSPPSSIHRVVTAPRQPASPRPPQRNPVIHDHRLI